jgi:hypothetical protein
MKKNGCKPYCRCMLIGSKQQSTCKYYSIPRKYTHFDYDGALCAYRSGTDCKRPAAQREAMKPKTRWTSKPAKKEGWYWIKTYNCTIYPAHTSETIIIGYRGNTVNFAIEQGSKRSVKPIEED